MQDTFRHISPPFRVYYGADSIDALGGELDRLGCRRVMVVCGRSVARDEASFALIRKALGARLVGVFDRVQAQSPLPRVLDAVEALKTSAADSMVAVGGGSAIVTSRAAAILSAEDRSIHELCTQFPNGKAPVTPRLDKPKLPQFLIPTTPTTAYGKVGTAVVDPASGRRLTLFDRKVAPKAVFFQPRLFMTAPPKLALGAALNAFVMAVQGLESAQREPLADALLFQAIRLLRRNMHRLGSEALDLETNRGELMLAALLAGKGTNYTSGGLASVLGHVAGARLDVDNGIVNAILLPHTVRFNGQVAAHRLADLPDLLRVRSSRHGIEAAIEAIETVLGELPIPRTLRALGIEESSLEALANDAGSDWYLHQNPRPVSDPGQIHELLRGGLVRDFFFPTARITPAGCSPSEPPRPSAPCRP